MKEYIERAVAVQELEVLRQEYEMHDDCDELVARRCRDALSAVPAADVAEVVRCKDCQYYQDAKINKKGFLICPSSGMEITETDYCSYGARMSKPRICEVLGVEPEERFYYKCEKSQENKYLWKITKEGERMFKEDTDIWRLSSNEKTLMDFINHPDRIIRKPRWTEQEVEDAKAIKRVLKATGIRRNRYDNIYATGELIVDTLLDSEAFPSLQPDTAVTIDEIIGGAQ